MNLKELLATHRSSGIMNKKFNENINFAPDVPVSLLNAWRLATVTSGKLIAQIDSAYEYQESIRKAISNPFNFIGRGIYKSSNKPFKGGRSVVSVDGIIKHPNVSGEYAFTYNYKKVVTMCVTMVEAHLVKRFGKYITLKSGDLFECGSEKVKIHGLVDSNSENEYAYTYLRPIDPSSASDADKETVVITTDHSSYINTRMVKPVLDDFKDINHG